MENQIWAKLNIMDGAMDDVHLKIQNIYKLLKFEFGRQRQLSQNIKNQIFHLIKLIEIICQNNPNRIIEKFPKIDAPNIMFNYNEICVSNLIKQRFQKIIRTGERKRFIPIMLLVKRIGDMNRFFNLMYQINEIKCLSKAMEILTLPDESRNFLLKAKSILQLLIMQQKTHLSTRMRLIAQQEKNQITEFLSCPNIKLYFKSNDCGESPNLTTSTVLMESSDNEINSLLEEAIPNTSTASINEKLDNKINHVVEKVMSCETLATSKNTEFENEINGLLRKLVAVATSQQNAMRKASKAIISCMSEGNLNGIRLEAERILLTLNLHYSAVVEELTNEDSIMEYQNLGQCKIENVEFHFDPKNLNKSYDHCFATAIICGTNIFVSEILSADKNGCVRWLDQIQLNNLKESDKASVKLYSCKIKRNKFWLFNKVLQIFNIFRWKKNIGYDPESKFELLAMGKISDLAVQTATFDFKNKHEHFINAVSETIPHVQCKLILSNV